MPSIVGFPIKRILQTDPPMKSVYQQATPPYNYIGLQKYHANTCRHTNSSLPTRPWTRRRQHVSFHIRQLPTCSIFKNNLLNGLADCLSRLPTLRNPPLRMGTRNRTTTSVHIYNREYQINRGITDVLSSSSPHATSRRHVASIFLYPFWYRYRRSLSGIRNDSEQEPSTFNQNHKRIDYNNPRHLNHRSSYPSSKYLHQRIDRQQSHHRNNLISKLIDNNLIIETILSANWLTTISSSKQSYQRIDWQQAHHRSLSSFSVTILEAIPAFRAQLYTSVKVMSLHLRSRRSLLTPANAGNRSNREQKTRLKSARNELADW